MKNKKLKTDYEDSLDEEKKKSLKKKSKKNKDKARFEEPKKPLIQTLDEEINSIEFCGLQDFAQASTKLSFDDLKNQPYFSTYFNDKLLDAKSNNLKLLNLSSISLIDACLSIENLAQNENEADFSNIEILDLSENRLLKIPFRFIRLFENLKEIKLNDNSIEYKNNELNELINEENDGNKRTLFKTIEILNMENNKIDGNLTFLSLFKNIKTLNLANNFITNLNLNYIVSQLPKLVDLNVGSNKQIVDSTNTENECIDHFNLRKLNLRNMNLNNLIYNLNGFKNIENLILDENQLEFIPTQLYDLEKLKILSLNSNKLVEINEKFCLKSRFRSNLVQLNLGNNLLQNENFSEKFYSFKNLLKLDLSGNKLKYIPNTLPESLRELKISHNRILTLMIRPVHFLNSTSNMDEDLETLRQRLLNSTSAFAAATQVQQLQYATVFYLRYLEYLDLSSNNLQEIPTDFGLLNVSLKYLDLSKNLIKNLDIKLCCRGLFNLKYLNLSSNFIKYIPEQICEFKQLEYLHLSHNSIQFLNYELCNELSNLLELDLSYNKIQELPIFAHKNGKLQTISLMEALMYNPEDSNLFTFGLKNLKKINLSSNRIQNAFLFTIIFSHCRCLVDVNLSSNAISSIKFESESTLQENIMLLKGRNASLLKELESVNLSNNQISLSVDEENIDKKLLSLMLKFYKLAPNLKEFLYDQLNGLKLNMPSIIDSSSFKFDDLNDEYELMINSLKVINLSNNNLYAIPEILFKMKNLKEIYLNGNFIKKIPSNLLHSTRTVSLIDGVKIPQDLSLIIENIETLELNDNKLEQVPENLFMHFKNLKNFKLNNNPLREPPKDAVCASYVDERDEKSENIWDYFGDDEFEDKILAETSGCLGPMRSYMIKYKKREG